MKNHTYSQLKDKSPDYDNSNETKERENISRNGDKNYSTQLAESNSRKEEQNKSDNKQDKQQNKNDEKTNDSDDNNTKSDVNQCFTGLSNLGNTCYMNTSLQALFATPEFLDKLSQYESDGGPLLRSLWILFNEMNKTDKFFVNPQDFRSVFTSIKPQFKGKSQQDAQEFLLFIIDGIHEEINKAKKRTAPKLFEPKSASEAWEHYRTYVDDSFLVQYFVGQFTSTITCVVCHKQRYCWDTFWDISLSLPKDTKQLDIIKCLNKFCESELLDEAYCSNCKQNRKSTKKISITRIPLILIIHLKLFGNDGRKVLPEDMTINQIFEYKKIAFSLYACICHRGSSANSGHYTAYCKHQSPDCLKWSYIDDENVEPVKQMTNEQTSGSYIVFYRRKVFNRYND